jgi:hypothetical protein
MKKVFLLIISLICSAYFCMAVDAQQVEPQDQSKQAVTLPPPVKIEMEQFEKASSIVPSPTFKHLCYGGHVIGANTSYEVITQEPRTGIKIEGYPPLKMLGEGGGTGRAERLGIVYRVIFKKVRYDVTVDANRIIKSISTDDEKFITPEGIRVGDALEKVVKASGSKPVNMDMCFYDLKLKSGWHATFGQAEMKDDGSLADEAKVGGFFKRD